MDGTTKELNPSTVSGPSENGRHPHNGFRHTLGGTGDLLALGAKLLIHQKTWTTLLHGFASLSLLALALLAAYVVLFTLITWVVGESAITIAPFHSVGMDNGDNVGQSFTTSLAFNLNDIRGWNKPLSSDPYWGGYPSVVPVFTAAQHTYQLNGQVTVLGFQLPLGDILQLTQNALPHIHSTQVLTGTILSYPVAGTGVTGAGATQTKLRIDAHLDMDGQPQRSWILTGISMAGGNSAVIDQLDTLSKTLASYVTYDSTMHADTTNSVAINSPDSFDFFIQGLEQLRTYQRSQSMQVFQDAKASLNGLITKDPDFVYGIYAYGRLNEHAAYYHNVDGHSEIKGTSKPEEDNTYETTAKQAFESLACLPWNFGRNTDGLPAADKDAAASCASEQAQDQAIGYLGFGIMATDKYRTMVCSNRFAARRLLDEALRVINIAVQMDNHSSTIQAVRALVLEEQVMAGQTLGYTDIDVRQQQAVQQWETVLGSKQLPEDDKGIIRQHIDALGSGRSPIGVFGSVGCAVSSSTTASRGG
ncbi:MAG TPA: hypothetical protein VK821_11840 [Dehalococcoidia bacterium]|nr:hypothetical protein [Dehalococcoidia bacterium]